MKRKKIKTITRNKLDPRIAGGLSPATVAALNACNAKRKGTSVVNTKYRELMDTEDIPERDSIPPIVQTSNLPIFMTRPGLRKHIIELLNQGHHINTVLREAKVSRNAFYNWLKWGQQGKAKEYYDFYMDVRQAEGVAEMTRLNSIIKHSDEDWKASAWIMERRWSDRWGRRAAIHQDINITNKTEVTIKDELATKVIEHPSNRELARSLLRSPSPSNTD